MILTSRTERDQKQNRRRNDKREAIAPNGEDTSSIASPIKRVSIGTEI